MSDLVAEFLAREQEELGDIDDFQFDDMHNEILNSNTEFRNDEFENIQNIQVYDDFAEDDRSMDRSDDFFTRNIVLPRIEPEQLKKWKIDFEARIEAKDKEELKRKAQQEVEAKKELDDWNAHHNEQLANKRKLNKDSQSAFVKDRDQPLPGSEWHRVCKMCDFGGRPVVVGVKGAVAGGGVGAVVPTGVALAKDTSRMKAILLSLKNEPLIRG